MSFEEVKWASSLGVSYPEVLEWRKYDGGVLEILNALVVGLPIYQITLIFFSLTVSLHFKLYRKHYYRLWNNLLVRQKVKGRNSPCFPGS
jgi:hypothetical protein